MIAFGRVVVAVLMLTSVFGCDRDKPPLLIVANAPAGDTSILHMKAVAKVGERVTVRGRIGGQARAFIEEDREFRMMDLSVPYCGAGDPEAACPQPWDYCCEKKELKAAAGFRARIAPPQWRREHFGPLKPLMEVVVTGTVSSIGPEWIVEVNSVHIAADPGG